VSVSDRVGFPQALALLVAGSYFMEMLDGTIIATAAPAMAQTFGVRPVDINVVMTAYLIAVAVLVPASGWVGERFGTRTVFLIAVAVFTLSSAACAACGSLGWLVVARVVQGFGGALMVPVGRLVVLRAVDQRQVLRAMAFLTWPGLIAPVVAPAIGGLLTGALSWRWIFVLNLPLGVVAFVAALRLIPPGRAPAQAGLDWWGFVWVGTGLAGLVVGMDAVGAEPADVVLIAAGLLAGFAALVVAVRHLRRTPNPMLDLSVLRIRTFRVASFSGTGYRLLIFALPFVLPQLFQVGFGWGPVQAGVLLLFLFVGNLAIKPATTPLLRRFGFRPVLLVSCAGGVASIVGMAFLTAGTPLAVIAGLLLVSGVFRSVGFSAYNAITYDGVQPAELPRANALATTLLQIASGIGVAVGALAVRVGEPLSASWEWGAVGAYRIAFLLLALLLALSSTELLALPRNAGAALTAR
jgi:EmrB/QacA subfamily drug resistance transporter